MTAFPGFEHFYMVHDPVGNRPFRGKFEHTNTGWELSKSEEATSDPIPVTWAMGGGTPGDVIWTTSGLPLILGPKVVELLVSGCFTGWSTYPVSVRARSGEQMPGYVGLAISGRVGEVNLSSSVIELEESHGRPWPVFRGRYFDPLTWSGDDFCMQANTCVRIVSERVANVLEKARISNLTVERLTETTALTIIFETGKTRSLLPADFKLRVQAAYAKRDLQPPPEYQ